MRPRPSLPPYAVAILCPVLTLASLAAQANDPASMCTQDAMLVLDASGSMLHGRTQGPTLMEGARAASRQILPAAGGLRRLGLTTLGPGPADQCANVEVKVPVRADAGASILHEIDKIDNDGGTPLALAIQSAADALDYKNKPGVMVIISDGDETCGRDPCAVADTLMASARDLTIHVIGFSTGTSSRSAATCLAQRTNGVAVFANDVGELEDALRETLLCPQVSRAAPHPKGPGTVLR